MTRDSHALSWHAQQKIRAKQLRSSAGHRAREDSREQLCDGSDVAWFDNALVRNALRSFTPRVPRTPPDRAPTPPASAATAPSSSPTPIWARAAARPRRWPTSWPTTTATRSSGRRHRRWLAAEAPLVLDGGAAARSCAEILRKVDAGTRVIFVPGNHDEFARDYAGRLFAGIEVINEAIHETADGKRLLGAAWRPLRRRHRLRQMAGPSRRLGLRHGAALATTCCSRCASALGLPYWSLSAWLKHKVKNAVEYISRFEEIVAHEARLRGVDGVVCGHIHHAEIRMIGDVLYLNDGDWVESCSALVEDARGNMEILRWATPPQRRAHGAAKLAARAAARKPRLYPRRAAAPGAGAHSRRGGAFEDPDRHRCLGAAGQWRGAHAGDRWARTWPRWATTCAMTRRQGRLHLADADLSGNPPGAVSSGGRWTREIRDFAPDAVHIATEGTLGLAARAHLHQARHRLHHLLPHPLSPNMSMPAFRFMPENAGLALAALVPCARHRDDGGDPDAEARTGRRMAFKHLRIWSRGVDVEQFHPIAGRHACPMKARSGSMSAAWRSRRISRPSWRWTCPAPRWWWATARPAAALAQKYPAVKFARRPDGRGLVRAYAASDVFVFPSRTDTFGLVLLEALACGLPVAAYPVEGPRDVVGPTCRAAPGGGAGRGPAQGLPGGAGHRPRARHPVTPRAFAEGHSWRACTLQFLRNLAVEPDLTD